MLVCTEAVGNESRFGGDQATNRHYSWSVPHNTWDLASVSQLASSMSTSLPDQHHKGLHLLQCSIIAHTTPCEQADV